VSLASESSSITIVKCWPKFNDWLCRWYF
jgi:hypothetical protein